MRQGFEPLAVVATDRKLSSSRSHPTQKLYTDRQEKMQFAQQAEQWLKRVVEISQLQSESIK
jgi:hypothetical protein